MFNLLLSDCGCPRMLSFLPDRVTGLRKIRISEHPYSYCDQLGALLGFPENRSPTFWTKVECHSSTAICSTRISFGDALSEPDLLSRIECLNTESASRPALAFEAVAHGDADGVASNCYLELSATARGFAIRHVDYLSTETRNSIRARAQFLVPQEARRELPKFKIISGSVALQPTERRPDSAAGLDSRGDNRSRAATSPQEPAQGGLPPRVAARRLRANTPSRDRPARRSESTGLH